MALSVTPQRVLRAPAFTPDATYGNRLRQLITDPSSFQGTPGFQFARDQGVQALDRGNSTIRNTPNALLDAAKFVTGLASQDYGNEVSRLGQLTGQEQSYDLGLGAQDNQRYGIDVGADTARHATDVGADTARYGADVGAATSRYNTDANTGLGYFKSASDFILGRDANNNNAQNNWFNYDIGKGRNANDAAGIFANYDLGQGRNAIDWYNAGTNRGAAQSGAYNQAQTNAINRYRAMPRGGVNPATGGQWYTTGG